MALWDRISSRGNVQDRRGSRVVGLGGGLGLTGIALLLLLNYLGGGEITDVLGPLTQGVVINEQTDGSAFEGEDSYEVFASTVLGSTNDLWNSAFSQAPYEEPTLVLFRGLTQSSCGGADARVGPHYCPLDETIYLDETFFDELTTRLGAQGGDVAEAYVIAHEVGHHVQQELGIMDQVRTQEEAIKLELQADCFAGLWFHSIREAAVLEPGEIAEAMDAAAAVGDDRIQERVTGRINPESWTHGSSAQRQEWFNRGYETGSVNACNTFE